MEKENAFTRFDLAKTFKVDKISNRVIKSKNSSKYEEEFQSVIGDINVHYHPDVYEMEDILEMIDYKKEGLDRIMMVSIMEHLELQMLNNLKQNDICVFPYMGRGKINKAAVDLRRANKNYKDIRVELGKDVYRELKDTLTNHSFDINREYDKERANSSAIRKKYRNEITELRLLYGENYVDLFIKSMMNFQPSNPDKDAQYEFDSINGNIDENGNYTF